MNGAEIKGRILVAEDDPLWRDLLCQVLTTLSYSVLTAADGEQAWAQLTVGEPVDLVITDRNMPKLDGMELLGRVRGDARLQDVPVIFQTALDGERNILDGLAAGVFYYLEKPYTLDLLRSVVAAALTESQQRRQLRETVQRQARTLQLLNDGQFRCRTLDEARELAALLSSACPQPDETVTGLSELLINAVEHGNLGVSYEEKGRLLNEGRWLEELQTRLAAPEHRDKSVRVEFARHPECITITIEDTGAGFDWSRYLEIDPERITHSHGRGIAMARLLSFSALEYQGCGNRVVATISLKSGDAAPGA